MKIVEFKNKNINTTLPEITGTIGKCCMYVKGHLFKFSFPVFVAFDKYIQELENMGFKYGWCNEYNGGVNFFLYLDTDQHAPKDIFDCDVAIDIICTNTAKRFCYVSYTGDTYASKRVKDWKMFDVTHDNWDIAFQELKEYLNEQKNGLNG